LVQANQMTTRTVEEVFKGRDTSDGAGVRLKRIFGYHQVPLFDPFLLLDEFGSDDPSEYVAGFPWHPHRGIETITYVLTGDVEHGDSLGNSGVIEAGDVQWMTAGRGIVHQEMPLGDADGVMRGFQLWANLPAAHKMTAPRYRDVSAGEVPEVEQGRGATVKVICGEVDGVTGPVGDVVIEPLYLDVSLGPGGAFDQRVERGLTAFVHVFEGEAAIGDRLVARGTLALLGDGDTVAVNAGEGARFLLVAGRPLGEPVAWGGPIVMNTREEVDEALEEYRAGTFLEEDG